MGLKPLGKKNKGLGGRKLCQDNLRCSGEKSDIRSIK